MIQVGPMNINSAIIAGTTGGGGCSSLSAGVAELTVQRQM